MKTGTPYTIAPQVRQEFCGQLATETCCRVARLFLNRIDTDGDRIDANVSDVLVMRCDWRNTSLLTLHNFSGSKEKVEARNGY
jgi:hypothetical protein